MQSELGARRKAELHLQNAGSFLQGRITLLLPKLEAPSGGGTMARLGSLAGKLGVMLAMLFIVGSVAVAWSLNGEARDVEAQAIFTEGVVEDTRYSVESLDRATALVEEFHRASTVEEKQRLIVPFPGMDQALTFHYAMHGNEAREIVEFTRRGFYRADRRVFAALQGQYGAGENVPCHGRVARERERPSRLGSFHGSRGNGLVGFPDQHPSSGDEHAGAGST